MLRGRFDHSEAECRSDHPSDRSEATTTEAEAAGQTGVQGFVEAKSPAVELWMQRMWKWRKTTKTAVSGGSCCGESLDSYGSSNAS